MGAAGGGGGIVWGEHSTLAGFTLLRGIDIDRSGALVLAIDGSSGRRVLARVLSPALRADSRAMRRIRADIARLQGVRSPHLANAAGFDKGAGAVLYEPIEGVSLARLLQAHEALDPAAAFCAVDDLLVALQALHAASLVHRDIRPGCVVVDDQGEVWLRDSCVPEPPLRPGGQPGNPNAMAPELWHGAEASPASDLYALTCVFVEALTGAPPFPTSDLRVLPRQHEAGFDLNALPPKVRPVAGRGLDPNVHTRQHDAAQYRSDLHITASTFLGDGWEERGRAWLAREARHVPMQAPEIALAPPADAAVLAASTEAPAPAVVTATDDDVVAPRTRWWRRPATWSAALVATLAVVVVVLVAATAGSRDATPPAAPAATPSPTAAPTQQAPFSAQPTVPATAAPAATTSARSTASPTPQPTPTPSATPSPPRPTFATPTPTPKPTPPPPTPTPTPCPVLPPVC